MTLVIYTVVVLASQDAWHLFDYINLPIHETGHLLFIPLGETLTILGGALFLLIVPLTFAVSFARRGDHFGATVCAWWCSQNVFYVASYVADAQVM